MPSGKDRRGPQTRQAKSSKTNDGKSSDAKSPTGDRKTRSVTSLDLQQRCLDIFRDALNPSVEDAAVLQEVKGHLYHRDFTMAFGKDEYLRVYASRWSPSRALCYLQIFNDDLKAPLSAAFEISEQLDPCHDLPMAFLGGGAGGELVAAGTWLGQLMASIKNEFFRSVSLKVVDIADWSAIVGLLEKGLTTPPTLSKYASQAKKDANKALLGPDSLKVDFRREDILEASHSAVADLVRNVKLVTFMFTLNELYAYSMANTQQLLLRLKAHAAPGTLLLVVDSPGSYSTVSINGAEKKYPMQWLLQHTMRESASDSVEKHKDDWVEVLSNSSKWFRLSNELLYPIELEDMRYQIHLFQKS